MEGSHHAGDRFHSTQTQKNGSKNRRSPAQKRTNRHIQLFHIGQVITSEINLDVLFEVIAVQTKKIMESERCSVFLEDETGTNLTAFVSTDLKRNEIKIPKHRDAAGWVFGTSCASHW